MKNNLLFCINSIIAPAIAIKTSIIIVSVAPDIASLTLPASLNLDIISPTFLVEKNSLAIPIHAYNILATMLCLISDSNIKVIEF